MPMMQGSTSLTTNTVSANVLAGLLHEFASRPSGVRVLATGSATGLLVTMVIGNTVIIQDQAIGLQNRFPIVPDDVLAAGGAMPGDRLLLTFRNPTGGTLVAFWRVDVEAVL